MLLLCIQHFLIFVKYFLIIIFLLYKFTFELYINIYNFFKFIFDIIFSNVYMKFAYLLCKLLFFYHFIIILY